MFHIESSPTWLFGLGMSIFWFFVTFLSQFKLWVMVPARHGYSTNAAMAPKTTTGNKNLVYCCLWGQLSTSAFRPFVLAMVWFFFLSAALLSATFRHFPGRSFVNHCYKYYSENRSGWRNFRRLISLVNSTYFYCFHRACANITATHNHPEMHVDGTNNKKTGRPARGCKLESDRKMPGCCDFCVQNRRQGQYSVKDPLTKSFISRSL